MGRAVGGNQQHGQWKCFNIGLDLMISGERIYGMYEEVLPRMLASCTTGAQKQSLHLQDSDYYTSGLCLQGTFLSQEDECSLPGYCSNVSPWDECIPPGPFQLILEMNCSSKCSGPAVHSGSSLGNIPGGPSDWSRNITNEMTDNSQSLSISCWQVINEQPTVKVRDT